LGFGKSILLIALSVRDVTVLAEFSMAETVQVFFFFSGVVSTLSVRDVTVLAEFSMAETA
jgi:hypothetical protein